MLPTHLTTNEVKNAAGTEVEFLRFDAAGRTVEFQQSAETPNLEHRLKTSHQESGSGVNERRRSMARVDWCRYDDQVRLHGNGCCVSSLGKPIVGSEMMTNHAIPLSKLTDS